MCFKKNQTTTFWQQHVHHLNSFKLDDVVSCSYGSLSYNDIVFVSFFFFPSELQARYLHCSCQVSTKFKRRDREMPSILQGFTTEPSNPTSFILSAA